MKIVHLIESRKTLNFVRVSHMVFFVQVYFAYLYKSINKMQTDGSFCISVNAINRFRIQCWSHNYWE
jgi:hypothetical protein